jgi:hypothetical protein
MDQNLKPGSNIPFVGKDLGSFGDGSTCLSTIDCMMFCYIGHIMDI